MEGTWENKANGTFNDVETSKPIKCSSTIVFVKYGSFIHFVYQSWNSENGSPLISSCGYIRASEEDEKKFTLVASHSNKEASVESGQLYYIAGYWYLEFNSQRIEGESGGIKKLFSFKVNNCTLH